MLRPQRLAAPAKVYVEQFSAHPLEGTRRSCTGRQTDTSRPTERFSRERNSPDDKPVYEFELQPGDGYYPLPYMAVQADGSAWRRSALAGRAQRPAGLSA